MTTPRASDSLLEFLHEAVQSAVAKWPGIGRRKLLVSIGWTVNEQVFTLVPREGRIVVRIPDEALRQELLAAGAEPWVFSKKAPPRNWLRLPESMHEDSESLTLWLRRACDLTRTLEKKPRRKRTGAVKAAKATKTTKARPRAK